MRTLAHLAGRLYNTPLLIHPDKAEVIERVFAAKLGADLVLPLSADIDKPTPEAVAYASPRFADKPYIVTEGQVAVIPVRTTRSDGGEKRKCPSNVWVELSACPVASRKVAANRRSGAASSSTKVLK